MKVVYWGKLIMIFGFGRWYVLMCRVMKLKWCVVYVWWWLVIVLLIFIVIIMISWLIIFFGKGWCCDCWVNNKLYSNCLVKWNSGCKRWWKLVLKWIFLLFCNLICCCCMVIYNSSIKKNVWWWWCWCLWDLGRLCNMSLFVLNWWWLIWFGWKWYYLLLWCFLFLIVFIKFY